MAIRTSGPPAAIDSRGSALTGPPLTPAEVRKWAAHASRVALESRTRQARPQTTPLPLGAYVGTYESPALGRMVWTLENGRLQVRMGVAAGDVEVFNGAQHEFRVTLTGGGSVVAFDVTPGARQPSGLRWADQVFTRVQ